LILGWRADRPIAPHTVKNVLFVCTGNICRSPMAEGLFRHLIANRRDITGRLCRRARRAWTAAKSLRRRGAPSKGIDISRIRSQPLTSTLVDRATHIFAMTGAHLESIQMLFPKGAEKSYLLREFEEPGTTVWRDVPDPIGSSREVYLLCAETIKNALPSVLAFVEQSELAVPAPARGGGPSSYIMADLSHQTRGGSAGAAASRNRAAASAKSTRRSSIASPQKRNGSAKTSS
jgi:protein-tyrosine-phosphatase